MLETTRAQAIDIESERVTFEHAIATLRWKTGAQLYSSVESAEWNRRPCQSVCRRKFWSAVLT